MAIATPLAAVSLSGTFPPGTAPGPSHAPAPLGARAALDDFHQTPPIHDARSRSPPAELARAAKAQKSQYSTLPIPRCASLEIADRATPRSLRNVPWPPPTAHRFPSCLYTLAIHRERAV